MEYVAPRIDFCIVCEGIRPEIGSKATILGFFGLLPRVEITLSQWGQPLILMFLLGTHGGKGKSLVQAKIINPNGTELLSSEVTEVHPNENVNLNTNIGFGFMPISFIQEGKHEFRLILNDKETYRETFNVKRAAPQTSSS